MKKNTNTKTILFTALFALGTMHSFAQTGPKKFRSINPENGHVRCATVEYQEYLKERNPASVQDKDNFEAIMATKIAEVKAARMQSPNEANAVFTIPVVVHVIHNGNAIGNDENIADAQVISQITVLNQDYRRMAGTPGDNNFEAGADTEIEFCLAKVKPDGTAFNGIDRVDMGNATWNTFSAIDDNLKPATQWDPEQYFNIWVVKFGGELEDDYGLLGYAQFPDLSGLGGLDSFGGSSSTDGVVIGYRYFGSSAIYPQGTYFAPYNRGRTTTHEVGHALGLRHISGDNSSCTANSTDSQKDYCPDTPATSDYNYTCNVVDSCPAAAGEDMIENYMDYTNDACMSVFTQNQKTRMKTVLQNSPRRSSLGTSTVCQEVAGTEEFKLLNGINLYPNPTQTVLNISLSDNELPDGFVIYNSLGQTISTVKVNGSANLVVNTSAYINGVYFIKIDKGTATKTLKFIKN